jgi:hypothetical protein
MEPWFALLTVRVDERSNPRELLLRLSSLDETSAQSLIGRITESTEASALEALVERLVRRQMNAPERVDLRLTPSLRVSELQWFPLDLEIDGAKEPPRWTLYTCLDREACTQFEAEIHHYDKCLATRYLFEDPTSTGTGSCVKPVPNWKMLDLTPWARTVALGEEDPLSRPVEGVGVTFKGRSWLRLDLAGDYLLIASVGNGAYESLATERVTAEPWANPFRIRIGLSLEPPVDGESIGQSEAFGYYHYVTGSTYQRVYAGLQAMIAGSIPRSNFNTIVGPSIMAQQMWSLRSGMEFSFTVGLVTHIRGSGSDQTSERALGFQLSQDLYYTGIEGSKRGHAELGWALMMGFFPTSVQVELVAPQISFGYDL